MAHYDGWNAEQITRNTVAAALKVARRPSPGRIVREQIPYSPTFLDFLMLLIDRFHAVDIIDFEGLGANYYHNRNLLEHLYAAVDWLIVECPDLAKTWVKNFTTPELKFTPQNHEKLADHYTEATALGGTFKPLPPKRPISN